MKAIHIICRREDGTNFKGLSPIDHRTGKYKSCCWDITAEEAVSLQNGWLYLHPKKSAVSDFGSRVVSVETVHVNDAAHGGRIAFVFEARREARNQKWRGADHGRAWTGGLVDLTFPHEAG